MVRIYAGMVPERDGLHDAYLPDACCQFLECRGIKLAARLVRIGINLVDSNLVYGRAALRAHLVGGDESIQTAAQCRSLRSAVVFLVYCHCLSYLFSFLLIISLARARWFFAPVESAS